MAQRGHGGRSGGGGRGTPTVGAPLAPATTPLMTEATMAVRIE